MGGMLTVAEAARLIGRTTDAVRKLIGRSEGRVKKLYDANRYTFRVRTADLLREARRTAR
jgi:hypothetical protein